MAPSPDVKHHQTWLACLDKGLESYIRITGVVVLLLLVPEPGDGGQQLGVRLLVSPGQLPDLVVVVLSDRLLVTRHFISITMSQLENAAPTLK